MLQGLVDVPVMISQRRVKAAQLLKQLFSIIVTAEQAIWRPGGIGMPIGDESVTESVKVIKRIRPIP